MCKQTRKADAIELADALEADLLRLYGPLLTGDALRLTLGYPSMGAMRQAIFRGGMPVHIFSIDNRRGKFALSKDVATWLAEQRNKIQYKEETV